MLTCSCLITGNAQCSIYSVSLAQRIDEATCIVEGTVVAKRCIQDVATKRIYTLNEVEVFKLFKGQNQADTIIFLTLGGLVDGVNEKVYPALSLTLGAHGVFLGKPCTEHNFIGLRRNVVFEVVADQQGFIQYNHNNTAAWDVFHSYSSIDADLFPQIERQTNASLRIIKNVPQFNKLNKESRLQAVPIITGFSPKSLSAGTKSILTITGSGFGSRINGQLIFFADANKEEGYLIAPIDEEYLLWSDTQIQVYVPESAGTGTIHFADANKNLLAKSQDTLKVRFARSTDNLVPRNEYDLINQNSRGGYTWQFSQEFNTNTDARNAFTVAMNRWKCATGVNWEIGSVSSVNVVASDNINIVRFADEGELPTGVLGRCETQSRLCGTNNNVNYVTGLDISFRRTSSWNFRSGQIPDISQHDFESVALHELGHAHELNHVIDETDIMHYSIPQGKVRRSFTANNLEGSEYIMRQAITSNSCGPNSMSRVALAISCSPIPIQPTNQSKFTVSAGNAIQFSWTQITGAVSYNLQITNGTSFSGGSGSFFLDTNIYGNSTSVLLNRFPNTKHFWKVRANYATSTSDFSGALDFTVQGSPPTALPTPSQLNFAPLQSGLEAFLPIQFTNPANASGTIRIRVSVQPTNGTPIQIFTIEDTFATFTLQPGQINTLQVRFAPNAATQFTANLVVVDRATGRQIAVIPVSGTGIAAIQPLSAPVLLTPANGSSLSFSNRTVAFSWQSVANAESYRFVIATARSSDQLFVNYWSLDTILTRNNLTITLPERTPLYWGVQARNATTQSSFSGDFTLNFIRDTAAVMPTLTTLTNITMNSQQAAWQLDRTTPRDSGFVHGTNLYLHRAKATAVRLPTGQRQAQLSQVAVWFAYKRPGLTNQTYRVEVYSGTAQTGPQSLIASRDYILAGAAAGNVDMVNISLPVIPTVHTFTPAVTVGESFFVGVNFGQYGVSGISDAGITASNLIGRRVAEDWEMGLDGRWTNMSDAWFPQAQPNGWNMWLAAGVQLTTTSVREEISKFQLSHYPNPCSDFTTIQYTLAQTSNVKIELYSLLGTRLATLVQEPQAAGNYVVPVDVRTYPSGQYYYRLGVNGEWVSRSLQVVR